MCNPAAIAGVATVGQMATGSMQAYGDASSKEVQAGYEAAASGERANRIYFRGKQVLADQRLQTLNNGIEGGSGSALEVGVADAGQVELDALTELYGGYSKATSLREEARLQRENSPHGILSKLGQPLWAIFGNKGLGKMEHDAAKNTDKLLGY
jgi:hypothetical protein